MSIWACPMSQTVSTDQFEPGVLTLWIPAKADAVLPALPSTQITISLQTQSTRPVPTKIPLCPDAPEARGT
jgi:hypothetical protein